jgi:hypothetical protein
LYLGEVGLGGQNGAGRSGIVLVMQKEQREWILGALFGKQEQQTLKHELEKQLLARVNKYHYGEPHCMHNVH